MLSSTSSSNSRLPHAAWERVLVGAFMIWLLFVVSMEVRLAARGFVPTVVDSDRLWLNARRRADTLGHQALILTGGSRMQLDLDQKVLHQRTGLTPVLLAIDGSSFLPVLRGLAEDPAIVGTVLVDYTDHVIAEADRRDEANRLQALYERKPRASYIPDYSTSEAWLTDYLHTHLRSYADSARPLTSLLVRILQPQSTPQYIVTLPDRSRLADYSRVQMPNFYYGRVLRNLGQDVPMHDGMTWGELDAQIRSRIERIPRKDATSFLETANRIAEWTRKIEARGGRVLFFVPPMSGLVREINDRQFPRNIFWNRFSEMVGGKTVHYEDFEDMVALNCPDGSHLDSRDRQRYTAALAAAIAPFLK